MRITRHPLSLRQSSRPAALTIGNFDGVHLGHATILDDLVTYARGHNLVPTVMTFEPHPKAFFSTQTGRSAPNKILPLRNKLTLLAQHGIEHAIVLPFNASLAAMQATDFVEQLLLDALNMHYLQVGDDFCFGAKRAGNFALLQNMSASHGFALKAHESVQINNERISSSTIRHALARGDLDTAKNWLGHPLVLSGHIVRGQQLGRTIGCPTINLKMPLNLATQGIYAVTVELQGQTHQGVASIGTRPSVKTNGECWLEVHILDFDANAYGELAHVTLWCKIRDEAKFDSMDTLMAAIHSDIQVSRDYFLSQK